jgi:very-short-patch-repair endonuclease
MHERAPADHAVEGPKNRDMDRISARRREILIGARLAAQHGCISLTQLISAGLSEDAIQRRVEAGRLFRIHTRVFALTPTLVGATPRSMAAVLASGPGAVLSHASAALLWEIWDGQIASIDVTAPNRRGRAPSGIVAHRDSRLSAADRTVVQGIPCTTVARTLIDFAAGATEDQLRGALGEAEQRRLIRHPVAREAIRRNRRRRGTARFRVVLDEVHPDTRRTRSELERSFLRLCLEEGLPRPQVNVKLLTDSEKPLEVDFLWREAGLVLEADSRRFHATDRAFLVDHEREQRLQLAGWRVTHCTWEQAEQTPRALAATIRSLYALGLTGRNPV